MSIKASILGLVIAAGGIAGVVILSQERPEVPPAKGGAQQPAASGNESSSAAPVQAPSAAANESSTSAAPAVLHSDGKNRRSPLAPGRYPMEVPFTDKGIDCGGGRFLPLLNGMETAPALNREPNLGPVPPVVAKIVDDTGIEWYEHADGSATTTRWQHVSARDWEKGGMRSYWDPATVHGMVVSGDRMIDIDPSTGKVGGPPPGGGQSGGQGVGTGNGPGR